MSKLEKELENLSGAYALDAVTDAERDAFERYLLTSDETRYEVTEFADTAVLMGLATAPVAPPASLKAGIMSAIASTTQASRFGLGNSRFSNRPA